MNLQQIVATFAAHQWLALALFGAVYLRKLVSPGSNFPVNFSANWRPVFVALFGAAVLGITADEGGASIGMSVLAGFGGFVAAGAMDGLLVAIWGDAASAPGWAKALVWVVDDIESGGGGGGGAAKPKTDAVAAAANALPKPPVSSRIRGLVAAAGVLALALFCSGCLSSAPTVPVTPANQAQVTSCENTATWHDGFVVGDFTFTGGAATMGVASALETNTQAKNVLAISGAVLGGLAGIATTGTAFTASNFVNDQCSNVVGNLPAAVAH